MKILQLEAWAAANADYDAAIPPVAHVKTIPNLFSALSGIFWSISYILMARKSFRDRSYSMPIYCLCINISWETIFGFVYGPDLLNAIVFGQWMIVDIFLVYTTIKYGAYEWQKQPLIARNLAWIISVGVICGLVLNLAIAYTFIPTIGRQVVFFTAWPLQLVINIGYIAQLLSRGSTRGQSWAIWANRAIGTLAAGLCFAWKGYYWPERFSYAWTPFGAYLIVGSWLTDFAVYPVVFAYVKAYEERERSVGKATNVNGSVTRKVNAKQS